MDGEILHCISGDLWAGAEVQALALCLGLVGAGNSVRVVIFNDGELAKRLRAEGIEVEVWDETRLSVFQLVKRARRYLIDHKPAIVHSHDYKEAFVFTLGKILARSSSALVRTIHGYFEYSDAASIRGRLTDGLDALVNHRGQSALITVSVELRDRLIAQHGYRHLAFIGNAMDYKGIAASGRESAAKDVADQTINIAMFARLVPIKRHDLALRSFSQLLKAVPERKIKLHLFGDGPVEAEVRGLAGTLKLGEHIEFHGHVQNVIAEMIRMDLILMPSDYEGMPMSLLEAQALGVPVIGHAVGGMKAVLEATGLGVLVEDHSVEGYVAAIEHYLSSAEAYTQAKLDVLNNLDEHFGLAKMVREYEALYDSVRV